MAFCQKCGAELVLGAKFCANCGTPAGETGNENIRKQSYDGEVKKCPSCGCEIPAFTNRCPSCGHEFTETKVDSSIKLFFEKLNTYSDGYETENDKDKKSNIGIVKFFLCYPIGGFFAFGAYQVYNYDDYDVAIPAFIGSFIFLIVFLVLRSPLTQQEKQKRNYIETFIVPNNTESIIEFLMLACSQIQPGNNPFTKEGKNVSLWNKVWKTKIRQTLTKSRIVLVNDKSAQEKINMIKKQYRIH